jgi:hypothetical protein
VEKHLTEKRIAWLTLLAVLLINGAVLAPELAISRVDLNDNAFHFGLIERIVQALNRGENPVDCWSPEWTLGYPVLRTYQPLAHLLVVAAWLMMGKTVSLMTVFVWARYLSVVLLPLSFFAAARMLGMWPVAAAAAAVLAPLVSTNFLYGIEYGSFTWAGSGLFPQAVAVHFLLLALGLGYRAVRTGKRLTLAGAALGLAFLAHFIYGYIGALSLFLLAAIPDEEVARAVRIRRTLSIGAAAGALSAFQLAPLVVDTTINHSRWEFSWKWDSFGPGQVLRWLFTGELLDHGRLPVLTLLALCGAAWYIWRRYRLREADQCQAFVLFAAVLWIAMFCGRPLWGPLLTMVGVSPEMQLHRVIGGAQIFLVLLAAAGITAIGSELVRRGRLGLAALVVLVLLYPMVKERSVNLTNDAQWGRRNLLAYDTAEPSIDATLQRLKERGGRVYPGLAASWGGQFKIGDVPFHAFLSTAQVPALSFLYHSMALTSDLAVRFNEWNPDHYRLFNIQTVVAPAEGGPVLPPFLVPIERIGRFRLLAAPGGGYFEVVDAAAAVTTSRNDFYAVNDRWLGSYWGAMRKHLLLDWRGDAPSSLPRIGPEDALPGVVPSAPAGTVAAEAKNGEAYQADFHAARDCYLLFKMTWHANWQAELDGKPVPTVMLSPGFAGVAVTAGDHRIRFQYRPEWWRAAGPFAGILVVILMTVAERRAVAMRKLPGIANADTRKRLLTTAGLTLLAMPVFLPLFSSQVLDGHDAFEYFPRLTEFHENISNGLLLPRWAPDLSNGNGQPLFLFNPPLIYYAGEIWHLLGFSFVTAMNLACAMVVIASAISMYLLGQLYFGKLGGWLAAAALLYAPYFAVDLYVRSAMAEFAAFPLAVLALYGFGAYAGNGRRASLLLGAAAYGGVIFSHNAAALLFTPLLAAFIVFTAWRAGDGQILLRQAGGFLLGLGLGAAMWLPSLAERGDIHIDRLLQGYLRYSNHFVYWQQLFYSPWGYGISVAGPGDEMSFALGWGHLLLAIGLWILAARFPESADRFWLRFFTAAGAVLCALMLRDAEWIWDTLPLLQYVEFPWRFLGPVAICLALLVAALGQVLDAFPRWRTAGFAAAMTLLIVPNLSHMAPSGLRDVDPAFWTPRSIAARGLEVTTAGEYVPRWVTATAAYSPRVAAVVDGDADVQQTGRTPVSWSAQVTAHKPSAIQLAIAYFPGWQVRIDGMEGDARPSAQTGQIRFDVPQGEHRVEAQWTRTSLVWLGDGITLLALAALAVTARWPGNGLGRTLRQNAPPGHPDAEPPF